jgi:diguanylate cyclase (GGDEF)-like protein
LHTLRNWLIGVVGGGVIAAAVLAASEQQRSTSQTNFKEAQAAAQMQVAMLNEERGLDAYLSSGRSHALESLYAAKLSLNASLDEARRLSADDPLELRAVADQAAAFRQWNALAATGVARREKTGGDDSTLLEQKRSAVIDRFLGANNSYRARLLVNRQHEESAAALLPVWLLLALGTLLATTGAVLGRRKRRAASQSLAFAASQARFVEAIQFAENETEAHELLTHHLESTVPESSVIVLNRNNSSDRLEPARELSAENPIREPLLASKPRSCLAVRLSRRYERSENDAGEALACSICGALSSPSSCQPLLVGGEVIGSVLVAHPQPLDQESDSRLRATVTQAAPVLANLRNLAIAQSRAATDALTGLPNRRSVDDTLRRLLAQADRTVTPLSVALLDLDHFKQINDTYGHDRGDDVLAGLASLLRSELRASDFAGRSGGEEFVLFLPNTGRDEAVAVAEKLRRNLRRMRVAGISTQITTSIGIATFPDDAATPENLMRTADRALYSAKQAGRDRVEASAVTPERGALVELAP